ncbi:restriction endonuclease subunit S [Brachybacterium timonense]|uniref:restriction endonuclease subunit S n=1 Tax=Brachybacterium timonense TaxID=2050896 RepID=UPI000D0B1F52|nr:restriction endonuclease subunit S [Brachybacterium timonense]
MTVQALNVESSVPLSSLADVVLGKMLQPHSQRDGDVEVPYLRSASIQDSELDLGGMKRMWASPFEASDLDLRAGDVVVSEGGSVGRAVVLREDLPGVIFQNSVNRLRPRHGADGRFLTYVLSSIRHSGYFSVYCDAVSIAHLTAEKLGRLRIPAADSDAQQRIADYLDRETAKIDTLIEKQRRLLTLLVERRQAVRKHVALRGVDSDARTASAPDEWAGQLPIHWRFVPLLAVSRLGSGHTPSKSRPELWVDAKIPWISLRDVGAMRGITFLSETHTLISERGLASSSARILPAGTVVLSRDATIGRTAIMGRDMATSQHFATWTCGPEILPEYLHLVLSDAMQDHLESLTDGSTLRTIGMGDICALRVPLPPVDEQREIVIFARGVTAKIDTLIAKAERFIELAQERRAALITAAVTGQIEIPTED